MRGVESKKTPYLPEKTKNKDLTKLAPAQKVKWK
jgi:hypothetical protein